MGRWRRQPVSAGMQMHTTIIELSDKLHVVDVEALPEPARDRVLEAFRKFPAGR